MELNEIREIAKLMEELELSILEISENGKTIKLERKLAPASAFVAASSDKEGDVSQQIPSADTVTVVAPMVGIFYASPSPGATPFVSVGTKVKRGDVLCIIEAMKLMNEITAEQDGTISEILVSNGQVVEYGHPMFRIKKQELV